MPRDNSANYDVLYTPEVDPRKTKHKCQKPNCGEIGSVVGCKECGKLWYFKYFPQRWYRSEDRWQFIPVRWYHFRVKRLVR